AFARVAVPGRPWVSHSLPGLASARSMEKNRTRTSWRRAVSRTAIRVRARNLTRRMICSRSVAPYQRPISSSGSAIVNPCSGPKSEASHEERFARARESSPPERGSASTTVVIWSAMISSRVPVLTVPPSSGSRCSWPVSAICLIRIAHSTGTQSSRRVAAAVWMSPAAPRMWSWSSWLKTRISGPCEPACVPTEVAPPASTATTAASGPCDQSKHSPWPGPGAGPTIARSRLIGSAGQPEQPGQPEQVRLEQRLRVAERAGAVLAEHLEAHAAEQRGPDQHGAPVHGWRCLQGELRTYPFQVLGQRDRVVLLLRVQLARLPGVLHD